MIHGTIIQKIWKSRQMAINTENNYLYKKTKGSYIPINKIDQNLIISPLIQRNMKPLKLNLPIKFFIETNNEYEIGYLIFTATSIYTDRALLQKIFAINSNSKHDGVTKYCFIKTIYNLLEGPYIFLNSSQGKVELRILKPKELDEIKFKNQSAYEITVNQHAIKTLDEHEYFFPFFAKPIVQPQQPKDYSGISTTKDTSGIQQENKNNQNIVNENSEIKLEFIKAQEKKLADLEEKISNKQKQYNDLSQQVSDLDVFLTNILAENREDMNKKLEIEISQLREVKMDEMLDGLAQINERIKHSNQLLEEKHLEYNFLIDEIQNKSQILSEIQEKEKRWHAIINKYIESITYQDQTRPIREIMDEWKDSIPTCLSNYNGFSNLMGFLRKHKLFIINRDLIQQIRSFWKIIGHQNNFVIFDADASWLIPDKLYKAVGQINNQTLTFSDLMTLCYEIPDITIHCEISHANRAPLEGYVAPIMDIQKKLKENLIINNRCIPWPDNLYLYLIIDEDKFSFNPDDFATRNNIPLFKKQNDFLGETALLKEDELTALRLFLKE